MDLFGILARITVRSTYNAKERVEIENSESFFPMLLLSRECHLVPAATGTFDILIFSRKNKKEQEKKVYEWIEVGETQFPRSFSWLLRFPSRTLDVNIAVIRSAFPSDCLARLASVSRVQGKYSTADRYSRDPLIHCLDGGDARRRRRTPGESAVAMRWRKGEF